MIRAFAEELMSAEAQGLCNAGYGEVSPGRMNLRNGYRPREIDTRVGTIEVAIPKLRRGSYFPETAQVPTGCGHRTAPTAASPPPPNGTPL